MGRPVVGAFDVAQAERLPLKSVEPILLQFRGAGHIETKRGKFGGNAIAKSTSEILFSDVIRLVDGKLTPIARASETCYERCSCPDEEHCGLRILMIDVRNAIVAIFERYSLRDVVDVTLRETPPEWSDIVFGRVSLRSFGSIQIVAHEGRMTRVDSTERTRIPHEDIAPARP